MINSFLLSIFERFRITCAQKNSQHCSTYNSICTNQFKNLILIRVHPQNNANGSVKSDNDIEPSMLEPQRRALLSHGWHTAGDFHIVLNPNASEKQNYFNLISYFERRTQIKDT